MKECGGNEKGKRGKWFLNCKKTYMLDAKVAHTTRPHLPIGNRILNRSPAFQPFTLAAIVGTMLQEEEIDIAQSASLNRVLDRSARGVVRGGGVVVGCQFRREPDILAGQGFCIRGAL